MSKSALPASQPLDLLNQEQSQASAALSATLRDLWVHVPSASQLKTWAEANPLMTAGVAAGAGALAGAIVTPSSRRAAPSAQSVPLEPRQSIFGSLLSQALPMMSMAMSEVGRNLLMASMASPDGAAPAPASGTSEQFVEGEGI